VTDTIGQLLAAPADPDAAAGDAVSAQQGPVSAIYDFLMLLWIVPLSAVWGSVLWMFIGLWTYGSDYGILGSLWFEISWLLSGFGCMFGVDAVCGIWDPDKNQNRTSTILD
jgi:hypothetical protein